MTTKSLSLAAELAVLGRSIQGVVDLLDVENVRGPEVDRSGENAAAVLHLIASRLHQLRRVVIGALDPKNLIEAHNETFEESPLDDPDVLLRSWTETKTVRSRRKR